MQRQVIALYLIGLLREIIAHILESSGAVSRYYQDKELEEELETEAQFLVVFHFFPMYRFPPDPDRRAVSPGELART